MSVLACGLNTCSQVLEPGPSILCCPSPVDFHTNVSEARIAFSHILWKTKEGWEWTGHGFERAQARGPMNMSPDWKVRVSENRITAINDEGSVIVWEKDWRTLHFQKSNVKDEDIDNEKHCNDLNMSTNIEIENKCKDIYVKSELQMADKNTEDIIISSPISKHYRSQPEDQLEENALKKVKLGSLAKSEEKYCPATDMSSEESKINFMEVAVEDNCLLALDTDGIMYSGGIPISLRVKVREVAVGKEHNMAVTGAGDILTWGSGMRGQLGIGELCISEKPVFVQSLQGVTISTVACGAWHCVALSDSGDAYVWGWNESGQLGFPGKSESSHSLFHCFEHRCQCPNSGWADRKGNSHNIDDHREDDLVSGWQANEKVDNKGGREALIEDHTTVRREHADKRVNQERSKTVINVQASPLLLDFWSESVIITKVQCGDRHTLYLLDDGSVWAAGMNKYGQLGVGHTQAVTEPSLVLRQGVRDIYAGGWNSVFITSNTSPVT